MKYTKNKFITDIMRSQYFNSSDKALQSKLKDIVTNIRIINFHPAYIIGDNIYDVWKYFFAASRSVNKLKQNNGNKISFTLKIFVFPERVSCIYDDDICYKFELPIVSSFPEGRIASIVSMPGNQYPNAAAIAEVFDVYLDTNKRHYVIIIDRRRKFNHQIDTHYHTNQMKHLINHYMQIIIFHYTLMLKIK